MRRHRVIRQLTDTECGAAVLATLCGAYGHPVPMSWLRERMNVGTHGTDLETLRVTALDLGLDARACMGSWDLLAVAPLPAILHMHNARGDGHFVVLFEVGDDHAVIGDPERGVVTIAKAALIARWSGAVLLAVPTVRFPAVRAPAARGLRDFVREYLEPKWAVALAAVTAIAATAMTTGLAFAMQFLLDDVLLGNELDALHLVGIGMACAVVFQAVFGAMRAGALLLLSNRLDRALQARCHRHVFAQPMGFFASRRVGEVAARLNESGTIAEQLGAVLMPVAFDAVTFVLAAGCLFAIDARLAAICGAVGPALALAVIAFRRRSAALQRSLFDEATRLQATVVGHLGAMPAIKAYGHEQRVGDAVDGALARTLGLRHRLAMAGAVFQAVITVVTGGFAVAVLWVGGALVSSGELTAGTLISFYAMVGYSVRPLRNLTSSGLQLQTVATASERTGDLLALATEAEVRSQATAQPTGAGAIELRGVTFAYDRRHPVLADVDLSVPAGSTIAIVGESGSGKSTLARLILGFHEPSAGAILHDGIDLRELDIAAVRAQISWVDQEATVIDGTVRDNLLMARPSATDDELAAATRAARVDDLVRRLPAGLDTRIGERGTRLSGGERQRICIARALLRDPAILLLDEATSHLDTATEAAIQHAVSACGRARTTVVIAHRLSTVANADQIVVLRDGCIVERGRHSELVGAGGVYAAMWSRQAGPASRPREVV